MSLSSCFQFSSQLSSQLQNCIYILETANARVTLLQYVPLCPGGALQSRRQLKNPAVL